MIDGANNNLSLGKLAGGGVTPAKTAGAGGAGASSFADVLKNQIDEVSRLQQDASKAVEDLATGADGECHRRDDGYGKVRHRVQDDCSPSGAS
jgi:flagellar hook-basal body complex protein FliE